MTLAKAKAQVKALGLRLTKDTATGEYTVHVAECDGPAMGHRACYFTDSLSDALDTASHMAEPTITYSQPTQGPRKVLSDVISRAIANGFPVVEEIPAKPTLTYTYVTDDWLVIRTDSEGHQSCVNTECWPEWGPIGIGECPADETPYKEAVIERAIRMKPSNWLGCADGWCGKCESSVQSGDFD